MEIPKAAIVPFLDDLHRERFYAMVADDETAKGDAERYQLFYVITGCDFLYRIRERIYDTKEHRLVALEQDNSGYPSHARKMLTRAMHLYNGSNADIPTVELMRSLDAGNTKIMMYALGLYAHLYSI